MYDRPFRWWVQSVMPLVFDDSLSYYEVLAKLTKYIEGLTGDVEQIEKVLETIEGIEDITQFTEFLERIQLEIGNLENLQTDTKASLVSAINEVALKADIAYWKPPTGIPESDLSQDVQDKLNRVVDATEYIINNRKLKTAPSNNSPTDLGLGTYSVPDGGIPWDTLSDDVKQRINSSGTGGTSNYSDLVNKPQINGHTLNGGDNPSESLGIGTYSKPDGGIPESDLSAEVQEKLNTSGSIADNQDSYIASRDYDPGELVYINGTLYRTKIRILSGTNMIPGNNIEVTDISSEIERINNEISNLQSGGGPDSWSISATVESNSVNNAVEFFEYFNATGGESYNFIVDPVDGENNPTYTIGIYKRDGTFVVAHTTSFPDNINRFRFTFVPTDTGEYYCTLTRGGTSGNAPAKVRVTLEFTQSQGISQLWDKVNEAAQLEPRVAAVEALTSQQQIQLNGLVGIPERVDVLEDNVEEANDNVKLFTGNEEIEFTEGYYIVTSSANVDINTPTASTTGYKYAVLDCVEGDKFTITSSGGTNPRAWCFIDANGVSLLVEASQTSCSNKVIIAPADSAKLVINAKNSEKSFVGEFLVNRFNALSNYYSYDKSWLTDYLMPNEYCKLSDMFSPSTTNRRSIEIYKNIIKTVPIGSSPTGQTYASFLVSKEPRYLGSNASPQNSLNENDFVPISIYPGSSLVMKVREVNNRAISTDRRSGNIIVCTGKTVTTEGVDEFVISSQAIGNYVTKYNENYYIVREYDLTELLPDIAENENIAIIYCSRYAGVEESITLEFEQPRRIDDSTTVKEIGNAILDCLQHVTWADADGQTYYNALNSLINS